MYMSRVTQHALDGMHAGGYHNGLTNKFAMSTCNLEVLIT